MSKRADRRQEWLKCKTDKAASDKNWRKDVRDESLYRLTPRGKTKGSFKNN